MLKTSITDMSSLTSTTAFHFKDLPPELRTMVYGWYTFLTYQDPMPLSEDPLERDITQYHELPLARVDRQIRMEFLPVFHDAFSWYAQVCTDICDPDHDNPDADRAGLLAFYDQQIISSAGARFRKIALHVYHSDDFVDAGSVDGTRETIVKIVARCRRDTGVTIETEVEDLEGQWGFEDEEMELFIPALDDSRRLIRDIVKSDNDVEGFGPGDFVPLALKFYFFDHNEWNY